MASVTSSSSNLRVVARIRPLSAAEARRGSSESLTSMQQSVGDLDNRLHWSSVNGEPELIEARGNGVLGGKRWFELDAVFDKSSAQREVYVRSGACRAVVDDIFRGYNATIMAYGQTGAGKTHTMGTAVRGGMEVSEEDGIIPRACEDLFRTIDEKCDGNARVELSFLEIYNDEIRDLLATDDKANLRVRETLTGEVYVSGVISKVVTSTLDILAWIEEGSKRRVVASTSMSAFSSRSHAICTLNISGVLDSPEKDDVDKFTSKLTLVDLAGSERIKKTGATGNRMQEGIHINKGLFVLGQVVSALAENGKRNGSPRRPPYRDSKLTRLLQNSLGGNSRTIMITCVSPADYNMDESISTLRYATSARNIKNKATPNIVKSISAEEAAALRRENFLLKNEVAELQETLRSFTFRSPAKSISFDQSSIGDDVSTVVIPVEDSSEIADDAQRISDLENEVATLKKQMKLAQADYQKATNTAAIELPALKVETELLREKLRKSERVERENEQLQQELEEARADAESARMAAAKLSDIMDQLRDLKQGEANNSIAVDHVKKEDAWEFLMDAVLEALLEEDTSDVDD